MTDQSRIVPFKAVSGPVRGQGDPGSGDLSSELLSGPMDPYRAHREFPARWRAYLVAHFGTDIDRIAAAFAVSKRCAGKWIDGETGCKGAPVAIAVGMHPDTAPRMLFHMAAE